MRLTNEWWLILWMFTGGAALACFFPRHQELVLGKWQRRWGIVPAVLCVLPYILWAGFRGDFGDTYVYRMDFLATPDAFRDIPLYLESVKKDRGFYAVMAVIHCLIEDQAELYLMIMAAFQILTVAFVCRKYTENYWLSIFIFIASTDYLSWVWNGMRQFTAVVLVFSGTGLIVQKKYGKAVLCVLAASLFHQSALLMLPVIFLLQGKPWNKKTLSAIGLSVLALVFAGRFTSLLDLALADTQYTNVVSDWVAGGDDGTNPLRVLVYAMPMLLSVVGYRSVRRQEDPLVCVGVNAAILTACIGIISIGTSGIFIGRLPIYVSCISNWILLPWEIENLFSPKTAKGVLAVTVLCYLCFFYYQMHVAWAVF